MDLPEQVRPKLSRPWLCFSEECVLCLTAIKVLITRAWLGSFWGWFDVGLGAASTNLTGCYKNSCLPSVSKFKSSNSLSKQTKHICS